MFRKMGIHAAVPVQEKKRSLRSTALAIIAGIRMQKRQQAWAENDKLREKLLSKAESMKRRGSGRVAVR